jgi:putative intracellular protease/amidase
MSFAFKRRLAMRWSSAVCAAFTLCLVPGLALTHPSPARPKVLMVVSSAGVDQGKTRPGFEMDEFAQAFLVFKANGLHIEVASPKGGASEADKFKATDAHIQAFDADASGKAMLQATRKLSEVSPGEHQAIFVVGGKGAMFDLASDETLGQLISAHAARGSVVSAVCHGVAALAGAKQADGRALVAGKRVTGFTDEEENEFGKKWSKDYPFWIEQRLRDQGAHWEEAGILMPHVVVDGRLVTGQNPLATAQAAEAVVQALGRQPVARALFDDEATAVLLQRLARGEREAVVAEIGAAPKRYKLELMGYMGHLQVRNAKSDDERRKGLNLMRVVEPYVAAPQMQIAIAQAEASLGEKDAARERLQRVLEREPTMERAQKLLASIQ